MIVINSNQGKIKRSLDYYSYLRSKSHKAERSRGCGQQQDLEYTVYIIGGLDPLSQESKSQIRHWDAIDVSQGKFVDASKRRRGAETRFMTLGYRVEEVDEEREDGGCIFDPEGFVRGLSTVQGSLGPRPGPVDPSPTTFLSRKRSTRESKGGEERRAKANEAARNFATAHHLRQRPYPNTRSLRHEGVAFSQTHAV
ncbi:hypothetical protein M0804_000293 [Polistes exclamans]|nr:hypothetical protein M0804_000293 [Polistes exclamans]